jgi:Bacterial conjugation TrbI-like protein
MPLNNQKTTQMRRNVIFAVGLLAFVLAGAIVPTAAQQTDSGERLPAGLMIPCKVINTVESGHTNTPVIGEVFSDLWQNGHVIVPAGAVVSCFAQSGAVRDRIDAAGVWLIVYPDGKQVKVHGIACDREFDPGKQRFGVEDGSAGLRGELVEADNSTHTKEDRFVRVVAGKEFYVFTTDTVLEPETNK